MICPKIYFSFLFVLFCLSLTAGPTKPVQQGPIHEAFVSQEFGSIATEAVPTPPPVDLREQPSPADDSTWVWIPGYWAWLKGFGDYIWISGVWRKPPPERQWVKGSWKQFPAGWVWLHGFWSPVNQEELTVVQEAPPDPLDEMVKAPSPFANGYFWIPGFWHYETNSETYVWHRGRWQLLSEDWVLTPAHYVWQEKGYVLVPAYWDWSIEKRGKAFSSIFVDPDFRDGIANVPTEELDPLFIVEYLYPFWPLYRCFYQHHFHFNQDKWVGWGGSPPWWQWDEWWCYSEFDIWRLWWWWTHPGYPQPSWMTQELAAALSPPPDFVVKLMKRVKPPLYVTQNGVVEGSTLLEALSKATGWKIPVFPSDRKRVVEIQNLALPYPPLTLSLQPTGSGKGKPLPKVNINPSLPTMKKAPERVRVPPYPQLTAALLELYFQICYLNDLKSMHEPPAVQETPVYYPPGKYQAPVQRPFYNKLPPQPRYETPYQGSEPDYQYPQIPMQIEHHDEIQSYPQPQRNPMSPRSHPLPGEESTLPNYPPPVYIPQEQY